MNLILLGAPGAGKGTQSQTLVDRLSLKQISTGDILRKAVSEETALGLKAREFMDSGNLVPDDVMIGIISERINKPDCQNGIILDGFPRTVEQARALDSMLEKLVKKLDAVVYFDVPESELIARMLSRSAKENRSDDNMQTIQNRLQVFKEKTGQLIGYYQEKGKLISLDGTGTPEAVQSRLFAALGL